MKSLPKSHSISGPAQNLFNNRVTISSLYWPLAVLCRHRACISHYKKDVIVEWHFQLDDQHTVLNIVSNIIVHKESVCVSALALQLSVLSKSAHVGIELFTCTRVTACVANISEQG